MSESNPVYFNEVHDTLKSRADELLPNEWTEADTLAFLAADDSFTSYDFGTEYEDFMEALEECAEEHIMSKVVFPNNLDLQREIAKTDITETELQLFKIFEPTEGVDNFLSVLRNASPSVYEGDMRMGRVSQKVLDVANDLYQGDIDKLLQRSD